MSLLLDVPNVSLGNQSPRLSHVPPYVSSSGPEVIELAGEAGLDLDPWQCLAVTGTLGERPDGKWAALQSGILVSRQNGKGGILEALELGGLFLLGERLIIHSAHQFDTSLEAFGRLLALIEDHAPFHKRVKRVSHAHGSEGIELKGGQRIRFRTRTKGGGRGFTGDRLILDEAMDIPESAHAALFPTLSARPNPQVIYTGSAVDQLVDDNGVVFARVREAGMRGDPGVAWFEWSADLDIDHLEMGQLLDQANWAAANPALGIRISSEYVGKELVALGARKFAVERLGVGDWPRTDDEALRVIELSKWDALADENSAPEDPVTFAFDVAPDRSSAAIGIAAQAGERTHVEVVDSGEGLGWVVPRLTELVLRWKPYAVVLDAAGPAGSLVAEVERRLGRALQRLRKNELTQVSAKQHGQGFGLFLDLIEQKKLVHLGQPTLRSAIDGASKRPLGDAFAWSRKDSNVDISPLVAVTLAVWGNAQRQTEPKPRVVNLNSV